MVFVWAAMHSVALLNGKLLMISYPSGVGQKTDRFSVNKSRRRLRTEETPHFHFSFPSQQNINPLQDPIIGASSSRYNAQSFDPLEVFHYTQPPVLVKKLNIKAPRRLQSSRCYYNF